LGPVCGTAVITVLVIFVLLFISLLVSVLYSFGKFQPSESEGSNVLVAAKE